MGELSPEELDAYWQDYRVVGALFGLTDEDMPASWVGLEAYVDDMLNGDVLHVTPQARTLARQIVLHPPVHLWFRPVVEVANFAIAGWLPPRLRREYRLWWHPARTVALSAGAESIRRVVVPLLPTPMRYRPDRPLSPELPFFFRQPAV